MSGDRGKIVIIISTECGKLKIVNGKIWRDVYADVINCLRQEQMNSILSERSYK